MQRGRLPRQPPALLQLQLRLDRPAARHWLRQLPVSPVRLSVSVCESEPLKTGQNRDTADPGPLQQPRARPPDTEVVKPLTIISVSVLWLRVDPVSLREDYQLTSWVVFSFSFSEKGCLKATLSERAFMMARKRLY